MRCGTAKGAEYSRAVTLAGRAANSVDLPGRCSWKVRPVVSSPAPDSRLYAHSASGRDSGGGGGGGEVVVELRDMTPVDGRQRKEITRTVGEMWEEMGVSQSCSAHGGGGRSLAAGRAQLRPLAS